MRNVWLALIFLSFFTLAGKTEENRYIVTYVYDGDTVKLHPVNTFSQKGDFKLRITDIDAPERNQPFGQKSRRALIQLCQGNHVIATTEVIAKDQYQRALGKLQCNQVDASLHLVNLGLAWYNSKYANDVALYSAEVNARAQKLGLWADKKPIAPWAWRKLNQRQ
ncbi:MAG TPA: thermonuclease family protein [Methylotenera sp.]|nr:thermonuclease family protein [Methylotenera sp.]HPV31404.1 thermonuclease family protein [Methylotenera sp.]